MHKLLARVSVVACSMISAALGVPAAANPISVPLYQVIDLGFNAVAINNQGWVVGNDASGAVLWTPESGITQIGSGLARDINNFGRVLGSVGSTGWIWDPLFGRIEPANLNNPAVMNDLGQVAGPPPTPLQDANGGYLWDPTFGFTTIINPGDFPTGSGADVHPFGINNRGEVVGWASMGEPVPFYWTPGLPRAEFLVGPPPDSPRFDAGHAASINETGQIAGTSLLPDRRDGSPGCDGYFCTRATVWVDFEPQVIGIGSAFDINDSGWVVGGSPSIPGGFAFLWSQDFGLLDLNSLISPSDVTYGQLTFARGTSINNQGWIIADGRYLLAPIPEPASLALLSVGLAGFALIRRRKR